LFSLEKLFSDLAFDLAFNSRILRTPIDKLKGQYWKIGVKLLFYSHYFAPSIGGVETLILSLAKGLAELRVARGLGEFELTFVTGTPAEDFDDCLLPFRVLWQPGLRHLLRAKRSAPQT
jgi:hypothetical protein